MTKENLKAKIKSLEAELALETEGSLLFDNISVELQYLKMELKRMEISEKNS